MKGARIIIATYVLTIVWMGTNNNDQRGNFLLTFNSLQWMMLLQKEMVKQNNVR